MIRLHCWLLILAMPLLLFEECPGADRPPIPAGQSGRSVVMAPEGMVCCAHPLAAQIGIDVLKSGGNAVDAAIAVNAALGLMEPMS
ncbi:MAG TPA: gamma-glutamyltransferase, partial [Gemmataceae bacterium]|nr:gamma-glutamyltransferase [Gemmataceae bacterium]